MARNIFFDCHSFEEVDAKFENLKAEATEELTDEEISQEEFEAMMDGYDAAQSARYMEITTEGFDVDDEQ